MSAFQHSTENPRRNTGVGGGNLVATLVNLWPYIWPADRRDLKTRVIFATVLLFFAKLATIAVPFTFKWATDALTGHGTAPIGAENWLAWAFAAPVVMTLAYGGTPILMVMLPHWRAGGFVEILLNSLLRPGLLIFSPMDLFVL